MKLDVEVSDADAAKLRRGFAWWVNNVRMVGPQERLTDAERKRYAREFFKLCILRGVDTLDEG